MVSDVQSDRRMRNVLHATPGIGSRHGAASVVLAVLLFVSACGSVNPLTADGGESDAGAAGTSGPGGTTGRGGAEAAAGTTGAAGDVGGRGGQLAAAGTTGQGGAAGTAAAAGTGGASCTPAVVAGMTCNCGGTCAPCPTGYYGTAATCTSVPNKVCGQACSLNNPTGGRRSRCTLNLQPYLGCVACDVAAGAPCGDAGAEAYTFCTADCS